MSKFILSLAFAFIALANWQQCNGAQIQGRSKSDSYYSSAEKMSWGAANVYCQRKGWQLVSVKSLKDSIDLGGYLDNYEIGDDDYWTSGNRIEDGSTWRWGLGGEEFAYKNWAPNETVDYGDSQGYCMFVHGIDVSWNLASCQRKNNFICKKE